MGIFIFILMLILDFIGIFYIIKTIINYIIFRRMKVGSNIKCYISINDCENNLEMFFKKFLYIYLDNSIFEKITIVKNNKSSNKEYKSISDEEIDLNNSLEKNSNKNIDYIIKNIVKENSFIEYIENAEIKIERKNV